MDCNCMFWCVVLCLPRCICAITYSKDFSADEDVAVIKCSLYLLKMALYSISDLDVNSFMSIINLVLFAVSKTVSNKSTQEINKRVLNDLECYLSQMNKIYKSTVFDVHDEHKLHNQVQVT